MRLSNVVMIGIALVCALVATLLSRAWLVSQSAKGPQVAEVEAEAKPTPTQMIAVTIRDLAYGDKITEKDVKLVAYTSDLLPKGSYSSVEDLLHGGSRVVLREMTQGEPILNTKLIGGEKDNTLPGKLTENMKAVTIRVNDVAGVAGFVQPEDRVDVFLTYADERSNERASVTKSEVVVLLQNVRVLAVDQATTRSDQPTPASAVTLEVNTFEAQKLTLAGTIGSLSLALNQLGSGSAVEDTVAISFDDLVNRSRVLGSQPAGPGPLLEPVAPSVTVTRSTTRESYKVLPDNQPSQDWQHATEILSHQGNGTEPTQ